ncbi:MAG: phytanoyl-CoA dioxygenase family protein [Rubrivivax sp.]
MQFRQESPRPVRRAVTAACVERWAGAARRALAASPPGDPDRQPTSGSLRLLALGPGWLDDFDAALRPLALGSGSVSGWTLLRHDSWLRVQHPVASRPPGEHPHGWHQDGALGHDFLCAAVEPARPRTMCTLWLPLVDCGNRAPSLEWLAVEEPVLLPPDQLVDAALRQRHPVAPRVHAVLAAGDALVFGGGLLHRTHVTPAMTQPRISLELRWVPTPA